MSWYKDYEPKRLVLDRCLLCREIEATVDEAVQQCMDEGVLYSYFYGRRSQVVDMFMDEYDANRLNELSREEGRAEGRIEGREEGCAEGRLLALIELVLDGVLSKGAAAARMGVTPDEFDAMAAQAGAMA